MPKLPCEQANQKTEFTEFLKQEFRRCYLRYAILHGRKEDVTSPNNITLHSSAAIAELVPALDFRAKTKAARAEYPTKIYFCRFVDMNLSGFTVTVTEID